MPLKISCCAVMIINSIINGYSFSGLIRISIVILDVSPSIFGLCQSIAQIVLWEHRGIQTHLAAYFRKIHTVWVSSTAHKL